MPEPARKTAEPSFEEAMGALEAIVQSLETERCRSRKWSAPTSGA